jgi:hypothetical protein
LTTLFETTHSNGRTPPSWPGCRRRALAFAPLKGQPIAGGWQLKVIGFALLVNGAWGLGAVLIARGIRRAGMFASLGPHGGGKSAEAG